jgi:hypothetical protein
MPLAFIGSMTDGTLPTFKVRASLAVGSQSLRAIFRPSRWRFCDRPHAVGEEAARQRGLRSAKTLLSSAQPGGNVTGLLVVAADLESKRLEVLKRRCPIGHKGDGPL